MTTIDRAGFAGRAAGLVAAAAIVTGCGIGPALESDSLLRGVARPGAAEPLGPLPASFSGLLPCADCPGIDYHLDLMPESVFYLKRSYRDRERSFDEIGAWSAQADTATLAIWGDGLEPSLFRIVDSETLRLLDTDGEDIESALNYSLTRSATFEPAELERPLRGLYRYFADAGSFVECESGRRFAVAQEADNAALERAYSLARREPGDTLLASFDARVTMRPPVEGAGLQPTVIVDRFTGLWPAETCGARMSRSGLLDTNWVLTRLGDEPVVVADGAREARLVLGSTGNRVTGFGGCNNFTGQYELAGSSIRFGTLAATLRACIDGGEQETGFLAALESASSYRLTRHHLELYDDSQALRARLEARALD